MTEKHTTLLKNTEASDYLKSVNLSSDKKVYQKNTFQTKQTLDIIC